MAPFNEIGGCNPLCTVTGAADTLPNAAAPDTFAAPVHHAAKEAANRDRLPACDAFPPFVEHNEGDRA